MRPEGETRTRKELWNAILDPLANRGSFDRLSASGPSRVATMPEGSDSRNEG